MSWTTKTCPSQNFPEPIPIVGTEIFSVIILLFKGLNYGVDFKGGTLIELRVQDQNINISNNPKCLLLQKKNQKISRNERCEATGKKFKQCCGALQ